jgi:hypothetical protein
MGINVKSLSLFIVYPLPSPSPPSVELCLVYSKVVRSRTVSLKFNHCKPEHRILTSV